MQLPVGDRLTDETATGTSSAVYTTNAGKNARICLQKVGYPPNVAELRRWSAHERISVKRATPAKAT